MKRYIAFILAFVFIVGAAYAQGIAEGATEGTRLAQAAATGQSADSPVSQMDAATAAVAKDLHGKLAGLKAQKAAVGQFPYQGAGTALGTYWANQLSGALTNTSGRSYTMLSGGLAGADWTISGEIVLLPGVIRVYTRLVRTEDRAVEAVFNADLERSTALSTMLASSGGGSSSGERSSQTAPDELEPDSWEAPLAYEMGADENATLVNRTIHAGDEDFFLLIPERDGRLTAETTGSMDTRMYLYDYESRDEIASNDDGGSGSNARIRRLIQGGRRYLAKVRGYGSSTNGSYAFRAYITAVEGLSSWENPIAYTIGVGEETTAVNRSITEDNERDYFLLIPSRAGQLTIETTGRTDTFMELYDAETRNKLADDDDSGSGENARIRLNVSATGRYIVMVRGYDGDTGNYGFRAYLSGPAPFLEASR